MLRSVAAASWPTGLKSFSPAHPVGRTGSGSEISTDEAMVCCRRGGESSASADNFWTGADATSDMQTPARTLDPRHVSELRFGRFMVTGAHCAERSIE
jgi:hypothetical protein